MAKVLSSISLDSPASPQSLNVNDTFSFAGTPTLSGGGGVQRYDFKWEVDSGGGYVTIAASGTGLITAGTNPLVNTNSQTQNSLTVTCDQAGSYTIRMAGAPTSGGSYTVLSSTQTVTVSAPAITGSGAVTAQSATVSGSGVSSSTGTGAVTAQSATVSGAGTVSGGTITGSGTPTAQSATVSGTGTSSSTGTGAPASQAATVSGEGDVFWLASGDLVAVAATVSGEGTVTGGDPAPTGSYSGRRQNTRKMIRCGDMTDKRGTGHLRDRNE